MTRRAARSERVELKGAPLSPGIAIGKTYRFRQIELATLKESHFPVEDIEKEFKRLKISVDKSREQLNGIYRENVERKRPDVADIFHAHIQLLNDNTFLQTIRDAVAEEKLNSEHVLYKKILDVELSFNSIENDIIKSKLSDVQDVYHRLLRNLLGIEHVRVTPLMRAVKNPILIAERLLPSDLALLQFRRIKGIVIEEGSTVSHVALIAKSFNIPTVTNIPGISSLITSDAAIIIDGYEGKVILNPTPAELDTYKVLRKKVPRSGEAYENIPCMTKDGVRIHLEANGSAPPEVAEAVAHGAEGIGLLRSEIFYLSRTRMPTQNEECAFYSRIFELTKGKPVTIRLLDIGADKTVPYIQMQEEQNPQMGVRGIRFLLNSPQLLERHLTCVLRSSVRGPVKVLIPFVAVAQEVESIVKMVNSICRAERLDKDQIKIGMMIEIPSVIWSLRTFVDSLDFFSIGTNDLVQFTFAACREDERLEEFRKLSLPVLFRMIRYVAEFCSRHNKDLSVCGEIASDSSIAPLLVGLGIRSLSVRPGAIDAVRREIECRSMAQMKSMSEDYLQNDDSLRFPL